MSKKIDPWFASYRRAELQWSDFVLAALAFVFTLFFYVLTLSPSVTAGDNGELTVAIHYLGIAHAPSYPIHSLFGKLFTFLPFQNIAWRANFFSAFCGALTIYFLTLVFLKLALSLGSKRSYAALAALVSALAYSFSNVLWGQSVTTEVYTISAVFHPLTLLILMRWQDEVISQKNKKYPYFGESYLLAYSFIVGVALGGHQTIVMTQFFVGFLVLFVLLRFQILPRRLPRQAKTDGLFGLALVVGLFFVGWAYYYLYVVSRASNLYLNDHANLKTGVLVFIFCNLAALVYYLSFKFFFPNKIQPSNPFQKASFLLIKIFGMLYLGFMLHFYLFIRSHGAPPINWGGISETNYFWEKLTKFFMIINRKQFTPNELPFSFFNLMQQLKLLITDIHLKQFSLPFYGFALIGLVRLFFHYRFFFVLIVIGLVTFNLQLTLFLNYSFDPRDIFFVEFFYLFSFFLIALLIPVGIVYLMEVGEKLLGRGLKKKTTTPLS